MLTPDDLSMFLSGEKGNTLEFGYDDSAQSIRVVRTSDADLTATVPLIGGRSQGLFDIEKALQTSSCGVEFRANGDIFEIKINSRHQLRSVLAIAANHLNWNDPDRRRVRFL